MARPSRPELLIVDPVLSGALLVLAGWVADPASVAAHWHSLTRWPMGLVLAAGWIAAWPKKSFGQDAGLTE